MSDIAQEQQVYDDEVDYEEEEDFEIEDDLLDEEVDEDDGIDGEIADAGAYFVHVRVSSERLQTVAPQESSEQGCFPALSCTYLY